MRLCCAPFCRLHVISTLTGWALWKSWTTTTSWGLRMLSISSSARRTGRRNMKCYFELFLQLLMGDLSNHFKCLFMTWICCVLAFVVYFIYSAELLTLFMAYYFCFQNDIFLKHKQNIFEDFLRNWSVTLMPTLIVHLIHQVRPLNTFDLYFSLTFVFLSSFPHPIFH